MSAVKLMLAEVSQDGAPWHGLSRGTSQHIGKPAR